MNINFIVTSVSLRTYPSQSAVGQALQPFCVTARTFEEILTHFKGKSPSSDGVGYQIVLAQELEDHLEVALRRNGLAAGSARYSPHLKEKADLALVMQGYQPRIFVEVEFRPNVEKDLVKFQIGYNEGTLAAAVLVLAERRKDVNLGYTTMPEFRKFVEVVDRLRPPYPLLMLGLRGIRLPSVENTENEASSIAELITEEHSVIKSPSPSVAPPSLGRRVTAQQLNRRWQVGAKHALYHQDGTWYHCLERFPGALFDPDGYLLFETREQYERCPHLSIGAHVNVRTGIKSIPGYVRVESNEK